MTGRRKRKGRALRIVQSIENSRALFDRRLRQATKPGHRTSAAAGYLLAVLVRTAPTDAESSDEAMSRALVAEAERLEAKRLEAAGVAAEHKRKEREDDRHRRRERDVG